MRCVTDSQIFDWLSERSISIDPYHGAVTPRYYLQFYAPARHSELDALARHYYGRIIPDLDSLVHLTDWSAYQESEMITMKGIRSGRGEERPIIEAPGHILPPGDSETGVALFGLSVAFGWSAYLYSSMDRSSLYNWEGEILDFWTESKLAFNEMKLILKKFNLSETKRRFDINLK